ncbi:phosphopantetheine adenylyltransferase [Thalassomonas viridans]|uniref:Phosphopantetheine adenylyltransferase n=1 Tax=Thalassomonas viridans TaxID=137584 RepID=A0AAE9Z487_9GAMM|nr:hypothetical protein [Thalassomonas viridans]WDE04847.1 phosphopantetheine adenylyltransferase [Thalassomonas viridans]
MLKAITACLIIVGLINFLPVLGLFSAQNMENAYSVSLTDNNLVILMRHRALLFGVLGGFILYSAFATPYQGAAMIMAGISMTGYVLLVLMVGGYNEAIFKVLLVDIFAIVVLLIAALLKYAVKKPSSG